MYLKLEDAVVLIRDIVAVTRFDMFRPAENEESEPSDTRYHICIFLRHSQTPLDVVYESPVARDDIYDSILEVLQNGTAETNDNQA